MTATDYFGRTINVGDVIWVPATVTAINDDGTAIDCLFTNYGGGQTPIVAESGTGGMTTNPAEGDRPPH